MMSRNLLLALLSVSCLTQCGVLQRTLQVPMRTLSSLTGMVTETDSEAMQRRAQQVQGRGAVAPVQPVAAGASVAAR